MKGDPDEALEAGLQRLDEWYEAAVAELEARGLGRVKAVDAAMSARIQYLDERPALQALAQRRYEEHQAEVATFATTFRSQNAALITGRRAPLSRPGQLPLADLRSSRRLARELGMPSEAIDAGRLLHAPPLSPPDPKWRGYVIEMFGEELIGVDVPPFDERPRWPGWFSDNPALPVALRAWRIIVRHPDSEAWLEARRDRRGAWSIAMRGLEAEPSIDRARKVLRGVALLRSRYNLPGPGRPTKWTLGEFVRVRDRETAQWRSRTGIHDRPCPPKELAYRMGMAESGHPWTLSYYYGLARRMNSEG